MHSARVTSDTGAEEAAAPTPQARPGTSRRRFLLGLGWGGISLVFASGIPGLLRFFWPRGGTVEGAAVVVGAPEDYRTTMVTTRWLERHGLWLVREGGKLFALESRCTHLGCTPRWAPESGVFRCPCHGSQFSTDGTALNGPATQPLFRLAIRVERGQLVVDRSVRAPRDVAEQSPEFYVTL